MKRRVPPTGPRDAKIALVGEASGREEELKLKPFVGQAGHVLDRALQLAGIERKDCYITNVYKFRPPNNDFSKIPPEELLLAKENLREELMDVNPTVVVALGGHAIQALTGHIGATKWRGSIIHGLVGKIVCAEHPAYMLPNRRPEDFHLLVFDLQRAKEESKTHLMPKIEKTMIIDPTFEEVMFHLWEAKMYSLKVTVDVETSRRTKAVLCVGISYKPNHAICIPIRVNEKHRWTLEEETAIWRRLQSVLCSPTIMKVGQNIAFDMTILLPFVGEIYPVSFDTMLAHHTLHIEDPHGLDHLVSVYTKHPYYKDEGRTWHEKGDIRQFWEYNCTDCIVTSECASELAQELHEEGLEEFFYGYIMPLFRVMWRVERFGVNMDMGVRERMANTVRGELQSLQQRVEELVGHPLNVNSPKQMKEVLYEELKLPIKRHHKTRRVTTDETALAKLAAKNPSEIFNLILELRGKGKQLGTYLEAKVDSDGRMRTSYLVSGTDTGRLSSRKSIHGSGMDLQNIPLPLRTPFVPDKGKILIEVDLEQAENRVVAWLADEERQMKIFNDGGDFHEIMAKWLGSDRALAKRVVHGTNYGMKRRLLSQLTGLSEKEADVVRNKYFEECPSINHWHLSIQRKLRQDRTLTTPLGRRRVFRGTFGDDMFRKAYAFLPQSTVADWLNINLVASYHKLRGEADILLQVHDSMLLQCHPERVERVSSVIKQLLEREFKVNGRMLSIPCKVKTGYNWGEMK